MTTLPMITTFLLNPRYHKEHTMATPIEQARAARSENASKKKEYALSLLKENPGMSGAQLNGMVHTKFGSGLSNATLTALRKEASKTTPGVNLEGDERLEVQLISQLQGLMKRQNYRAIVIPVEGTAQIRMMVERAKVPGEHVEAALH